MAVTFDAVGPSAAGASSTTASLSWSHTSAGNLVFAGVTVGVSPDTGFATTCTYGATAMTSLAIQHVNSTAGYIQLFYLWSPPTGATTITVTATGGTPTSMEGGSVSFSNAGVIGAPVFNTGNAVTSLSVVVPTQATTGMVVDLFAWGSGVAATSTQTQRWQKVVNSLTGAGDGAQSTAAATGGNVTMSYSWASANSAAIMAVELQAVHARPPRTVVTNSVMRVATH